MARKRTYPKLVRILVASVVTPILGLISYPIWAGMMVVGHYGSGLAAFLSKLLILPFLFVLMMTVLVVFFGERFTIKRFQHSKRFLIFPAIIMLESVIFGLVYKLLQLPYLLLDTSKILESVNVTLAMIFIYPTIIIIAAFIADGGLSVYNKYVLQVNKIRDDESSANV